MYKLRLQCISRAYQPILRNPMAKKYKHFQRTDEKNPQTNYRKFLTSPAKTLEQFMQISPYVVVVEKSFVFNCNRFCDTSMRVNFNLKSQTQKQETHCSNRGNYTHQGMM